MKKVSLLVALLVLVCFITVQAAPPAKAPAKAPATAAVKPAKVKITINNDVVLASYNGLSVKVKNDKDEFFSNDFFISLDDLKDLAKKRKVTCTYDAAKNKLTLGKEVCDLVAVNPDKPGSMFDTKYIKHNNKVYFDTYDLYTELGFSSASKLRDGIYYHDPKLDKKK